MPTQLTNPARDVAEYGLDPAVFEILTALTAQTGGDVYLEEQGRGAVAYVRCDLGGFPSFGVGEGGPYLLLGWTAEDGNGSALDPVDGATVVTGVIYRLEAGLVGLPDDEPVGDDGVLPAVTRFVDRCLADLAGSGPGTTEWEQV